MSVKQMALIWEYSRFGGVKLLLLLAIADHANDEGIAYPGITRLAHKIRRSDRYTRLLLQQLLTARPRELAVIENGGTSSRYDKPHLYQIVIKPHRNGLDKQLKANRAKKLTGGEAGLPPSSKKRPGEAGLPPRGRQVSGEGGGGPQGRGEADLPQTTTEPPTNHHTTTTTAAAAVDEWNGEWNWKVLGMASKLPKKQIEQLAALSPAAFVALYLYGLSASGIRTPKLWASKQLIETPSTTAGQPYDNLATLAPAQLAALCGWMRDGGPLPDLGAVTGAALAWRGFMSAKHNKPESLATAADQAINELGLSGLVLVQEPVSLEREAPAPALELDVWQRLLANGLSHDLNEATLTRLRRCHLVADNGPAGIVVGVPAAHDYDWLSRQISVQLKSHHRVELIPVYSK